MPGIKILDTPEEDTQFLLEPPCRERITDAAYRRQINRKSVQLPSNAHAALNRLRDMLRDSLQYDNFTQAQAIIEAERIVRERIAAGSLR